jgi:hypothetical protein
MQLDDAAVDRILSVVHLLAKGADDRRLAPGQRNVLEQNIEALIKHDSDGFVREFLARVRDAHGVLTPTVSQKLIGYP